MIFIKAIIYNLHFVNFQLKIKGKMQMERKYFKFIFLLSIQFI